MIRFQTVTAHKQAKYNWRPVCNFKNNISILVGYVFHTMNKQKQSILEGISVCLFDCLE